MRRKWLPRRILCQGCKIYFHKIPNFLCGQSFVFINMQDESENINRKTWNRNIEFVNKVGFKDGASDGQEAVYQSSFDSGYKQGFNFGFELGLKKAILSMETELNDQQQSSQDRTQLQLRDPRRINCQICTNVLTLQENVGNLFNSQQEQNNEILKHLL